METSAFFYIVTSLAYGKILLLVKALTIRTILSVGSALTKILSTFKFFQDSF